MRLHYFVPTLLGRDHSALEAGERRIERLASGAWLLISDNHAYDKEMIKPNEMQDVEILGRCRVRIGRIF